MQHELKQWNQEFDESIYDDGCHQEEFWRNHPSSMFPGWAPKHTIDRAHEPNHVRPRCRTALSADTNPKLWKYILRREQVDSSVLATVMRNVTPYGVFKRHSLIGEHVIPKGSRFRALGCKRMDPKADLLLTLQHDPLPISLAFTHNAQVLSCQIRNESERQGLLYHLDKDMKATWMGVRRYSDGNGSNVWVPKGACCNVVASFARHGWTDLLAQVTQNEHRVLLVTVVLNTNTQVMEQHWKILNRHKATLRHASRGVYDFLVHRLVHLLNMRRWS